MERYDYRIKSSLFKRERDSLDLPKGSGDLLLLLMSAKSSIATR